MDRKAAIAWVLSVCVDILRKSQAKTLSQLVAGALSAPRLTLAAIGRAVVADGPKAAKHAIKQVWRFVTNERIEPVEAMPLILTRLWRRKFKWHRKHPQRRPLLVSLDWTKVRSFHTLMAAVVVEGRALPLCWQSYRTRIQHKSQNALEYAMLQRLVAALPPGLKIVVLADRGFGRAGLIQECQKLQLDYLVRIGGHVTVQTSAWEGVLDQYPLARGQCHGWSKVQYRQDGLVTTNLILRWKKGLPPKQDEPWYLATSLSLSGRWTPQQLSDRYALRFDIEELFRDTKNEHLGWSLSKTRVRKPDRLDRLILIAALAYVLLVALGLWCRQHRPPRLWASNNRPNDLSAFAIGRTMLHRLHLSLPRLIHLLLACLATSKGKWG